MKSVKSIAALFLLAALIIFSSCRDEGLEGPAGRDGRDGRDGRTNVNSSTITSFDWTFIDPSWVITFNFPSITEEIMNSGAVLVYWKNGETYSQLPLTFYVSTEYSTTIEVSTFVGGLSLYWTDSDLVQGVNPGTQTFKIVVISASNMIQNSNVDYSNYEEVITTFDIIK
tara:strand:- start:1876 stop:2385 length:510 start_codon:yes stop_codon:yes gene_type:complete